MDVYIIYITGTKCKRMEEENLKIGLIEAEKRKNGKIQEIITEKYRGILEKSIYFWLLFIHFLLDETGHSMVFFTKMHDAEISCVQKAAFQAAEELAAWQRIRTAASAKAGITVHAQKIFERKSQDEKERNAYFQHAAGFLHGLRSGCGSRKGYRNRGSSRSSCRNQDC